MNIYNFNKEYTNIYISGDIHGAFRTLVYNIKRLNITDSVIIIAGDCGVGFEKIGHYEHLYRKLNKTLDKNNCILLLVRGNHDDPIYFEEKLIDFPKMKTVPDYSIVKVAGRTILCIGGAISLDRYERLRELELRKLSRKPEIQIYWENEFPIYNEKILQEVKDSNIKIDTVVTHTTPSFCYPQTKGNFASRVLNDEKLFVDVQNERNIMTSIYNKMKADGHNIKDWMYGHFHTSHVEFIDDTRFTLLDIEELKEPIN